MQKQVFQSLLETEKAALSNFLQILILILVFKKFGHFWLLTINVITQDIILHQVIILTTLAPFNIISGYGHTGLLTCGDLGQLFRTHLHLPE